MNGADWSGLSDGKPPAADGGCAPEWNKANDGLCYPPTVVTGYRALPLGAGVVNYGPRGRARRRSTQAAK